MLTTILTIATEYNNAYHKRCFIVETLMFGCEVLNTWVIAAYTIPIARLFLNPKAVTVVMIEIIGTKKGIFSFGFLRSQINVNGSREMILNEPCQ